MQPFQQEQSDQGCPSWMRSAFSLVPTKVFTVRFCLRALKNLEAVNADRPAAARAYMRQSSASLRSRIFCHSACHGSERRRCCDSCITVASACVEPSAAAVRAKAGSLELARNPLQEVRDLPAARMFHR